MASPYSGRMNDSIDSQAQQCLNCGARLTGRFCTECGQDSRAGRLKFREILANVADELFKLDLPIARTVIDLTWRPGHVASAYVAGRRQTYTNPLKYCLLLTAASLLVMQTWPMEIGSTAAESDNAELEQAWLDAVNVVQGWIVRMGTFVTLLLLPVQAALSRLFFLRSGRNFAEHCVLALYVHGHWYLFSIPLLPLAAHGHGWAIAGMQLSITILYPLAACGFFPGRYWTIIPRALLALALYLLAYLVLFFSLAFVYFTMHMPAV